MAETPQPDRFRFLYVDLNSFFASVEQQSHPEYRGRPLAVVPTQADTTCCIAASYEAKALGIKTGTLVGEAKRICRRSSSSWANTASTRTPRGASRRRWNAAVPSRTRRPSTRWSAS